MSTENPQSVQTTTTTTLKWYQKIKKTFRLITIEPTMFLYQFAIMFTSVVEQAFFVRKACLVNHNYSAEICDNIKDHEDITKEVQITTSNFLQFESIAAHLFPIVLALFLGAWSDKRGRKLPLLFGLIGKFIFYIMIIVNENQPTWPIEYIIYTATLPCALTGGDIAIFASCYAYITDVSTTKSRTIRVTILEAVTLITTPTGVALGSFMFNHVLNKSYTWMFAISAIMISTAIFYTFVFLKWQTSPKQRPLKELGWCGFWGDYFDKQHVVDSVKVLTKRRTQNRRLFLIIVMCSMALYTFVRDEKSYLFLHTQYTFKWDIQQYSNFKTFQSSAYIVVMFTAVPIMNKLLKWNDVIIILFGCTAHAIARLIYFFAKVPLVFYLGSIVCSFGPIAGPALRAFTSKLVPVKERGKVFALLSVCDNAVPFVSGVLYTQVYNATLGDMGGLFLLSFSFLILAIGLVSIIQFKLGNDPIVVTEEDSLPDKRDSIRTLVLSNNDLINKENNTTQKWYQYITVEPTMFLYMFAFMFTSVVEQAFFVRKACIVNHKYPVEVCDNIKDYPDFNKEVQITTSNFHQLDSIAGHIFPIILALFIGAWSDKRGRKFPMLLGLTGKLIYVIMIIINDNQPTWPLEYVIFTATIPSAFTGADIAIFASCFAYITDVSTAENRTIRVTILEVAYLLTMPTGVALGAYMFNNVLNKSYTWMFAINASLLVLALMYSLVALKWQTNSRQRPLSELNLCTFIPDFFDKQHVIDSIKVITKERLQNRRLFLIFTMITMTCYTFVRDEKSYLYLYTIFKFGWDVQSFSNFKTFQSTTYLIILIIAVPIMNKVLKWRDTVIILFGCIFYALARLVYFFADVSWVFYLGGIVCAFGPVAGPAIRSFTSKLVPSSERGKAFALLSVCDNAVPFISGVLYTQIYNATINRIGGIFLLSFSTLLLGISLMSIIQYKLGGSAIEPAEEDPHNPEDRDSVTNMIANNQIENDITIRNS